MATTGIRFNVDASQAIGEFKTLDDTIGALTKDLAEAQRVGDQSKAAQITHQIDTARLLKPDGSNMPGGTFGGTAGSASYSGMNANKLDMRLELLTKTIDELTHQLEEATEKGQSREAYNISATLNNVEQEKQRLEHEKKLSEQKTDESGAMDAIKRYGLARFFTQGLGYARQMDSAISGATGLQSTSDMIVATAASGILDGKNIAQRNKLIHGGATSTYVDTMLLMEQGNNPEMFTEIAKSVQDLEGKGNIAGQIERFKDIFKLNYHGSRDVYNMFQEFQDGKMTAKTFHGKERIILVICR